MNDIQLIGRIAKRTQSKRIPFTDIENIGFLKYSKLCGKYILKIPQQLKCKLPLKNTDN